MRFMMLALFALVPFAAWAADAPREIDFTTPLVGISGEVIKNCAEADKDDPKKCARLEDLTLGDVASIALETPSEDERNLDPKKKFERDALARKVWKNTAASLEVEDISLIKERIGKVYGPSIVGAAWPLLDPKLGAQVGRGSGK